MSFTVAIVGRPNVGKSTLFNRLVGKRLALVDDQPGVTRDRREGQGRIGDLSFAVIDTAGLEEVFDESLAGRMRKQTGLAVAGADVILFVIDARAGITAMDENFAQWLREQGKDVLVLANKCESKAAEAGLIEAYNLGLGDVLAISAEHGQGLAELMTALQKYEPEKEELEDEAFEDEAAEEVEEDKPMQMAIVGRPNVGKSTLVNQLIGEERLLTGPEAGITRDSIALEWDYGGRQIRLIDTAGLRRRAKVQGRVEFISTVDTKRSVQYAEVVVLVIDGTVLFEKQDLTIAQWITEEGRALVVAVNKWDAVEDKDKALKDLQWQLENSLAQVKGVQVVPISALKDKGLDKLMTAVFSAHEVWNKRVTTGKLNDWLSFVIEGHPPPLVSGRRLKIRYVTQIKTRPPTFALFSSRPTEFPESYLRYLTNRLREDFELQGVPIRMVMRGGKNPYAE